MKLQLNFQIVRFLNYKQRFSDALPRRGDVDYFAFCQRLGDADYSGSVKDLEMQVALCY